MDVQPDADGLRLVGFGEPGREGFGQPPPGRLAQLGQRCQRRRGELGGEVGIGRQQQVDLVVDRAHHRPAAERPHPHEPPHGFGATPAPGHLRQRDERAEPRAATVDQLAEPVEVPVDAVAGHDDAGEVVVAPDEHPARHPVEQRARDVLAAHCDGDRLRQRPARLAGGLLEIVGARGRVGEEQSQQPVAGRLSGARGLRTRLGVAVGGRGGQLGDVREQRLAQLAQRADRQIGDVGMGREPPPGAQPAELIEPEHLLQRPARGVLCVPLRAVHLAIGRSFGIPGLGEELSQRGVDRRTQIRRGRRVQRLAQGRGPDLLGNGCPDGADIRP